MEKARFFLGDSRQREKVEGNVVPCSAPVRKVASCDPREYGCEETLPENIHEGNK